MKLKLKRFFLRSKESKRKEEKWQKEIAKIKSNLKLKEEVKEEDEILRRKIEKDLNELLNKRQEEAKR